MSNVLYEPLPDTWNGYKINTDFQIGVQLSLCMEDEELTDYEAMQYAIFLLFSEDDGTLRDFPEEESELQECFEWFLAGWNHDNTSDKQKSSERIMDYFVDQGRIYADFRQIYGINLNNCCLHWWEFQWLLWNMPRKLSSFLQVIDIRTEKPKKSATPEVREAIAAAKKVYALSNRKQRFTKEQEEKIDQYDELMRKAKQTKGD